MKKKSKNVVVKVIIFCLYAQSFSIQHKYPHMNEWVEEIVIVPGGRCGPHGNVKSGHLNRTVDQ